MNVLVTGAKGFIGSALCYKLSPGNKIIGVDIAKTHDDRAKITWEQADLTDFNSAAAICEKYSPDVVIHCAGIAHQKIGAVDSATYMSVNSAVTENLAKAAAKSNPGVCFIFLSSVSVYGEGPQISQITQNKKDVSRKGAKALNKKNNIGIGEDGECWPSSDYAVSKLDAERRLIALYDDGKLHNLFILRLAPVYDRYWSLNLDRRVFAPKKLAYLRFGSGSQRMSALARPNLVEFIAFLIKNKLATDTPQYDLPDLRGRHGHIGRRKEKNTGVNIFNVCDAEPYEFNQIVKVFKQSGVHPNLPVIPIPLSFVWLLTRITGFLLPNKKKWIHSCYDKLASDLVFDNTKMMNTGFRPKHSLETIMGDRKPETGGRR